MDNRIIYGHERKVRQILPTVKVRPARLDDAVQISAVTAQLGSGMTNLPGEPAQMGALIEQSEALLAGGSDDSRIILSLECDGRVVGTASVWTRIGTKRPFYSFRITPHARAVEGGPQVTTRTLNLVEDFTGCSEVGGLVIDPAFRRGGIGRQAARTRYLFIAGHRPMFADRTVSELRGWQDENGKSPVWRALGKIFYQMPFDEADRLSVGDKDFIAPLAPAHPVYVELLPMAAQHALGQAHESGRRALELLLEENFRYDGHVDIFDGGPTVWAPTDEIKAVRESCAEPVSRISDNAEVEGPQHLVCAGQNADFRAGLAAVGREAGGLVLPASLARTLNLEPGMEVRHVRF
jgi:arginine N-succinyltransferase